MSADGPFGPVVNGTQIVFYEYRPNKAAGFSFVVLFGFATLGHIVYLFTLRAWSFIPFILGGIGRYFLEELRFCQHDLISHSRRSFRLLRSYSSLR